MQNLVIDKPYEFVPPYKGKFWLPMVRALLQRRARTVYGVTEIRSEGVEKLKASMDAGHGVMLAPNHCRDSDPLVLTGLSKEVGEFFYIMASWHLFMQGPLSRWILRRSGAFSVYREGLDRASVNAATDILEEAHRPLLIFPEGFISRTNDRLQPLLEGVSFIARAAAKRRAKTDPSKKVVVHPIAIRYHFVGDLQTVLNPVLDSIETRLSWRPTPEMPLPQRVLRVGGGLLALKEIEYFGRTQSGTLAERVRGLVDRLLVPLEKEHMEGERAPNLISRVKGIRTAILPSLIENKLTTAERKRRWDQLADVYLAQVLSCYPGDYVAENPNPDRILETIEGFEEDLTDKVTPKPPRICTLIVGDAIEVNPGREPRGSGDPLSQKIAESLQSMLTASMPTPMPPLTAEVLAAAGVDPNDRGVTGPEFVAEADPMPE